MKDLKKIQNVNEEIDCNRLIYKTKSSKTTDFGKSANQIKLFIDIRNCIVKLEYTEKDQKGFRKHLGKARESREWST